jgi:putative holliday junction resolvase
MPRIIAIDYGTKRVGLAATDELQLIANPLETVHSKDVIVFLKKYVQSNPIECFVLGMPQRLDGSDSSNASHVRIFQKQLQKAFPDTPIHLADERFTSQLALRALIEGGMKKKDRREKGNIDKVSAAIILQSFLEGRRL